MNENSIKIIEIDGIKYNIFNHYTLLWNNESPNEVFEGTNINIDLTNYTHVLIRAQTRAGSYGETINITKILSNGSLNIFYTSGDDMTRLYLYNRFYKVTNSGIEFRNAYETILTNEPKFTSNVSNKQLIPLEIYGVII